MISKAKFNTFVGSIGAAMGIFVFVAYIPQIIANMQGPACRRVCGSATHAFFGICKAV